MDETTEEKKQDVGTKKPEYKHSRTVLFVCSGLIIASIAFIVGWTTQGEHTERGLAKVDLMGHAEFGGRAMRGTMGEDVVVNPTDGTQSSQLTGVVTQVGSDSFTIAGNGTSKVIKTDAKTTYDTDKKVSVNDSVAVWGIDTNGTFTATSVNVLNH